MPYLENCLVCGTQFKAQRSTARFCSDVCRQRAHREKHRISQRADLALQCIAHLAQAVHDTRYSDRAWTELNIVTEYAKRVHAEITMHAPVSDWQDMPTIKDGLLTAPEPPIA